MRWGLFYLPTSLPESPAVAAERFRVLVGQARCAEDLGFHSVWLAEHHFQSFGGMFASTPLIGAAIAQETTSIRIGTAVVLLPYHHPVRVAEDYATLDLLSGGRLEFGVGHGFIKWEALKFGIPLDELRERFRENLDIVLRAWTEPALDFHGQFHQFEELSVWPRPLQQPHPAVWMGVTTTPESFELAGRQGYRLMVIPFLHETDEMSEKIQLYLTARRAAGHDPASTRVLAVYHLYVGEDDAEARTSAQQGVLEYIGSSGAAHALTQEIEEPASYRHHLAHRGALRGLTFDDLLERNRIVVGDARRVREQLRYLIERLRLSDVVGLFALGGLSDQQVRASMSRFIREVAPSLA